MSKGKSKATAAKPVGGIAIARDWFVHEVLLSHGWEQHGAVVTLLVARRSLTSGKVAAALLLVDLGCLGIKNAQVHIFKDVGEYNRGLRDHALRLQPMASTSINLAAKIVFTSVEYATRLGFKPDAVYAQAVHLLTSADPDADPTPVPTGGPEGKPFFVNGPYDDVHKIIDQLTRAVGAGNFHYLLQSGEGNFGLSDDLEENLPR